MSAPRSPQTASRRSFLAEPQGWLAFLICAQPFLWTLVPWLLATSLPQFFTAGFAWPREAIPEVATAFGRLFPADSAIDGLVRVNQLGAGIWEVAHDWRVLWCLALAYFTLAVVSAFAVKRGQAHA